MRGMAQVGVDDADHGGGRRGKAFDDGGAEAEFAGPMHHRDAMAPGQFVGERSRAVGRVVVHDDELAVQSFGAIRVEHLVHELTQPIALVIRGHDKRETGGKDRQGSDSQAL